MNLTLKEISSLINGKITGNENITITNLAKIEEAVPGDLTFLYLPAYEKYLAKTAASAVIVKPGFNKTRGDISYIETDEPNKAFSKLISMFLSSEPALTGVDPTAIIDPTVNLGDNCAVGKNVVLSSGCVIGNNVKIYHNTVIMEDVHIGDDVLIYPNITIREKCKIGNNVIIHSGTVIGSDGFGYEKNAEGQFIKIPQVGNVIIEDNVEIGSNVSIDRASLGSTRIGKGSKIDNLTQIAHNVVIGENTIISSQVGISGSTTVGSNSYILGQVGIIGHIEIGDGVVLIARSGVSKSITKPGVYFGAPAKEVKTAYKLEAHYRKLPEYAEKLKTLEDEITALKKLLKQE